MKVFIVYAHSEPTSFNAALNDRAVEVMTSAGHEVAVTDLDTDDFDPRAGRHDILEAANPVRLVRWSAGRNGDDGRKAYLEQWSELLLAVCAQTRTPATVG
ncbi:MAG: NAD(P)H-dependent oxidoreductase [Alphaproteobacteria bacterium]|nr:NAD(P)H-dependent oxidoreductase [Alphaproteobacteria bacterium]